MFSITVIPPAIEELSGEIVLLIDRLAKEPPRREETTGEIEMMPELINLHNNFEDLKFG